MQRRRRHAQCSTKSGRPPVTAFIVLGGGAAESGRVWSRATSARAAGRAIVVSVRIDADVRAPRAAPRMSILCSDALPRRSQ